MARRTHPTEQRKVSGRSMPRAKVATWSRIVIRLRVCTATHADGVVIGGDGGPTVGSFEHAANSRAIGTDAETRKAPPRQVDLAYAGVADMLGTDCPLDMYWNLRAAK
ncbi:unnamed protein product [Closterium sp. NIES-53]